MDQRRVRDAIAELGDAIETKLWNLVELDPVATPSLILQELPSLIATCENIAHSVLQVSARGNVEEQTPRCTAPGELYTPESMARSAHSGPYNGDMTACGSSGERHGFTDTASLDGQRRPLFQGRSERITPYLDHVENGDENAWPNEPPPLPTYTLPATHAPPQTVDPRWLTLEATPLAYLPPVYSPMRASCEGSSGVGPQDNLPNGGSLAPDCVGDNFTNHVSPSEIEGGHGQMDKEGNENNEEEARFLTSPGAGVEDREMATNLVQEATLAEHRADEEQIGPSATDQRRSDNRFDMPVQTQMIEEASADLQPQPSRKGTGVQHEDNAQQSHSAKGKPLSNHASSREKPNKKSKKSAKGQRLSVALGEEISVPSHIIQPNHIQEHILKLCGNTSSDSFQTIMRLFYGLASPDALAGLRDACVHTRGNRKPFDRNANTAQTIQALEKFPATDCATSILRRAHLSRLVEIRNDRVKNHGRQMQVRRRTRRNVGEASGRASSLALDEITQEAFPDLVPMSQNFADRRVSVQNKLRRGRNWHALKEKVGHAILTLLPRRGPFAVSDNDIENLPESLFARFIEVLLKHRGAFLYEIDRALSGHVLDVIYCIDLRAKYVFESMDALSILGMPYDSSRLVELCELNE